MPGEEDNDILDKIRNDSLVNYLDKTIECLRSELESEASSMTNEKISSKIKLVRSDIADLTSAMDKEYYSGALDQIEITYLGAKKYGKNNLQRSWSYLVWR